jgi:hypothetical protein
MSISVPQLSDPAATEVALAPSTFAVSKRTHLLILLGCLTVVGLSMTMSIQDREKVALPGMGSSLPELCHLKRIFHVPCPGCGLTRSFISMGHFDLFAAASYNVVGIPLFLVTLMQIPYRTYWVFRRDNKQMTLAGLKTEGYVMIGLSVLLIAQWLIRMAIERL